MLNQHRESGRNRRLPWPFDQEALEAKCFPRSSPSAQPPTPSQHNGMAGLKDNNIWWGNIMKAGDDPKNLCILASKVPNVKACKGIEYSARLRARASTQKVIDFVMKHPGR